MLLRSAVQGMYSLPTQTLYQHELMSDLLQWEEEWEEKEVEGMGELLFGGEKEVRRRRMLPCSPFLVSVIRR
jgi:hypothetical protein